MRRRIFIKKGALVSVGVLVSSSLMNCAKNSIKLDDLIGKSDVIFTSFPKEGDEHFAYYIISKSDFEHSFFKGEEVFVFSQNGKIVGYTIKSDKVTNMVSSCEYLDTLYGVKTVVFENDFGKEYEWKTDTKKIILSFTNISQDIPQHLFFSEATLNNNLLVF